MARYNSDDAERAFRIYLTDTLYYMNRNMSLGMRYSELFDAPKTETRTGYEVAKSVIERMGLKYERV